MSLVVSLRQELGNKAAADLECGSPRQMFPDIVSSPVKDTEVSI